MTSWRSLLPASWNYRLFWGAVIAGGALATFNVVPGSSGLWLVTLAVLVTLAASLISGKSRTEKPALPSDRYTRVAIVIAGTFWCLALVYVASYHVLGGRADIDSGGSRLIDRSTTTPVSRAVYMYMLVLGRLTKAAAVAGIPASAYINLRRNLDRQPGAR